MRVTTFVTLLAAVTLAACGGGSTEPSQYQPGTQQPPGGGTGGGTGGGSTSSSVQVADNSFTPDSTTLGIGTTVTWNWGSGYAAHNVTFGDGTTSGNKTGGTFTRTFNTAGKYVYNCTNHPGMRGVVMIQ